MSAKTQIGDEGLGVVVVYTDQLTEAQRQQVRHLQQQCFGDVPVEELMEDWVAESFAKVLAYEQQLVGCVSLFKRQIDYEGKPITLGGLGGTCTHADLRGKGIGTKLCQAAMQTLEQEQCDIAFLAVGASTGTARFYERFGFRLYEKPFTFTSASGTTKSPSRDNVGMIAPLCSPEIFEHVLQGQSVLHLGPEKGYW